MSFASDAQRKHFFANGGGPSGGSVPTFPDVQANGHWHTMTVCGVEKHVWIDSSEQDLEPAERQKIAQKEDRKSSEIHVLMAR